MNNDQAQAEYDKSYNAQKIKMQKKYSKLTPANVERCKIYHSIMDGGNVKE